MHISINKIFVGTTETFSLSKKWESFTVFARINMPKTFNCHNCWIWKDKCSEQLKRGNDSDMECIMHRKHVKRRDIYGVCIMARLLVSAGILIIGHFPRTSGLMRSEIRLTARDVSEMTVNGLPFWEFLVLPSVKKNDVSTFPYCLIRSEEW